MDLTVLLFIILVLSVGYIYIYKQKRRLKKTENVKIEDNSEINVWYIKQRVLWGIFIIGANNINPKIVFKKDTIEFNVWFITSTEKKYSDITWMEKDWKKNLDIRFKNGYSFSIRFTGNTQRDKVYDFLNR